MKTLIGKLATDAQGAFNNVYSAVAPGKLPTSSLRTWRNLLDNYKQVPSIMFFLHILTGRHPASLIRPGWALGMTAQAGSPGATNWGSEPQNIIEGIMP